MQHPSILYGVQGTGNGHISRARLMATEFARQGVDVDYLFSGREAHRYFDMNDFSSKRFARGLSFVTREGRIDRLATLRHNNAVRYAHEVISLRTDRYDLVISDFEPMTAWAARLRRTPTLALGHQYALDASAPRPDGDLLARWLLRHFAPADRRIGFHWHPYGPQTLPPMIDTSMCPARGGQGFTLVYLPFEVQSETITLLQQLRGEHFVVYSPEARQESQSRNVSIYPLSRHGFRHHLQRCSRVVCNTGFELIAEALHLGIPVLTRPLQGQYEQLANALSLKQLRLATVTHNIGILNLDRFVHSAHAGNRMIFPDVAAELATLCLQQARGELPKEHFGDTLQAMTTRLWSQVIREADQPVHLAA